jgi:3-hydroxybutyryl-CoA dehydrogenase
MERIGVVGCGLMGAGIAEVSARAGLDVVVAESDPAAAESGRSARARSPRARRCSAACG